MASNLQVAGILAAVATLALVLCSFPFLPIAEGGTEGSGTVDVPPPGIDYTIPDSSARATWWGIHFTADGKDQGFLDWYEDEEFDSRAKSAGPIYVAALVGALAASILLFAGKGRLAGTIAIASVLAIGLAMVLLLTALFEGDGDEFFDLAVGFYVVVFASLVLLGSGIYSLASVERSTN